ncbi:hypothetical protein C8E86_2650 [Catellatospora citrea]|nr:hypothetical protein C8E86_2650 [Catellatospora citrea]
MGASRHYLLDLTYEDSISLGFIESLVRQRHNIEDLRSKLIVTLTPDQVSGLPGEATGLFTGVGQYDVAAFIKKQVAHAENGSHFVAPIDDDSFRDVLEDIARHERPVAQIHRLTAILTQPGSSALPLRDIRDQYFDWRDYITENLANQQEGSAYQRALLIAGAFFDRSASDVFMVAANMLIKELSLTFPATGLLDGPEIGVILSQIDADIANGIVSITGRRQGLDLAIIDRVWIQRPALRHHLLTWLSAVAAHAAIGPRSIARISQTLTHLATSHKSTEVLPILTTWVTSGPKTRRTEALKVLEHLSVHPDAGTPVRRTLYTWAKSASSSELMKAAAEICGGQLGEQMPVIALVRLRLLISTALTTKQTKNSQAVLTAARKSLQVLCLRTETRSRVLEMLNELATGDRFDEVAAFVFMAIAHPDEPDQVRCILEDATWDQLLTESWKKTVGLETYTSLAYRAAAQWRDWADHHYLDAIRVVQVIAPVVKPALKEDFVVQFLGLPSRASITTHMLWNWGDDSTRPPAEPGEGNGTTDTHDESSHDFAVNSDGATDESPSRTTG